MKNNIISVAILLFVYCFIPASAQELKKAELSRGNFYGSIQIGVGLINTDSQLTYDSDNKKLESLDSSADKYNIIVPALIIDVNYALQNGTGLYIKTPLDSKYGLSLGAFRKTPIGLLDISGFYGIGDSVWKNPYLINNDRDKTNRNIIGSNINLKEFMGTHFDLNYQLFNYDVDKDIIGEKFNDLKRNGCDHQFGLKYNWGIGRGKIIQPSFKYLLKDMDGESQNYSGFSCGLTFLRITRDYLLRLNIDRKFTNYDRDHPIYNETREDREYGVMGMISWINPFEQRFNINILAGYKKSDSNINFFDNQQFISVMTIEYKFGNRS